MAHHSIGSIREMVRQYREELSYQTAHRINAALDASPGRLLLRNEETVCEKRVSSPHEGHHKRVRDKRPVSVQKLCWHETPPNGTPIHERTGTCTPLRFRMDDLADFQDLDRRAAEVLRRSQQVILEGGQARKSSAAPVSKRRPHLNRTQTPSCNGHCPPNTVERRSDRNHCRARDVVARNFEEIDKILGESNLIMEQNSSSDTQHKVLSYTKGGIDTRTVFDLRQGVKHVNQDVEAREVAAIKAANDYLNKSNGHSNERLLDNIPKGCAEEVLITTCRRLLNPPVDMTPDQERTFNTNKHELQTSESLPFTTLKSCNGTKVCEPTTTPTTLLESKWVTGAESERQWLSECERVHSGKVDFASMMASKGTWKYAEKFNFGESQLNSTQSLDLDGRDFAITTPSTVELNQQFPKKKSMKKSCKSRDVCSIQMPANFGQEMDPDLPVSESHSCTGRASRKGVSCLELDGMKQLSTEDLLLTLENPRKGRARLRPSLPMDRCEERGTYWPEQYLSPGKSSTVGEFESSFAGDPEGNDEESRAYSGILASLEQEVYDRTSAAASGSHRYVPKPDAFQRSKVRHSEDATQVLGSSAKCRGTKDKDNKSPAWMQSLNVRKLPSKWRAMSNTHTRSAASLMKGTVVVEELEELALRCNQPEGAATVNNFFKTRLQEDVDYRARIPNENLEIDHCKKSQFPAPTSASNGLPNGIISLPKVMTIRENPHVSIAQKDPDFHVAGANESKFSSGLDSLISEVVHEWVEGCSTSSPNLSASPDTSGVSPCSITDGQAPETGKCSANGDLFNEQTLPPDSELVKVARKKSVEALASVVQPLLAALQEAKFDEPIVTEFEADETICLLLEKLRFYEKKIRALKKRQDDNFESENTQENKI